MKMSFAVSRVVVAMTSCLACALLSTRNDTRSPGRAIPVIWQTPRASSGTTLSLAVVTPSVVIVDGVGTLIGLDPATGRQRWVLPVPFTIPYAGVVLLDDTLAVVVAGDGYIVFDPRDGRSLRTWVAPNQLRAPSGTFPQRLSDGRVVFVGQSRQLLALDPRVGQLDTLAQLPGDSSRGSYVVSLAVYKDTIYAPVGTDALRGARFRNTVPYRYALQSGVLDSLRTDPSDSASLARWLLPFDGLLVAATDYAEASWIGYDRQSGDRRWQVLAKRGSLGPSSQVAVVGDTMFAGGNDGVGYVIHIPSGRLVRSFVIPTGLLNGVVVCGDDLYYNVVGEITAVSRDGRRRTAFSGIAEGDGFVGFFSTGGGITVIGNATAGWTAFPCAPPS
jgi:outer membrane protein assembly factor BamB